MPEVQEVCRYVRSKNAGPFWITVDLFFRDHAAFDMFAGSTALQPATISRLFDSPAGSVKRFELPDLAVLKISYPRRSPQGGALERDMHGGQQYVRLLAMELAA